MHIITDVIIKNFPDPTNYHLIGKKKFLSFKQGVGWKVEEFNALERFLRPLFILLNRERYANTRFTHVLSHLNTEMTGQAIQTCFLQKMRAIWEKKHPGSKCPLSQPTAPPPPPLVIPHEVDPETTIQEITAAIERHRSKLNKYLDVIRTDRNPQMRWALITAIYVLMGIKPVFAFENSPKDEERAQLKDFYTTFMEDLEWIEHPGGNCFLASRHPLPEFNPRSFLKDLNPDIGIGKVAAEVFSCTKLPLPEGKFHVLKTEEMDQYNSYLLGFGPTWKAYSQGTGILRIDPVSPTFADEHYYQLGQAFLAERSDTPQLPTPEQCIEAGKEYHRTPHPFSSLKNKSVEERRTIRTAFASANSPERRSTERVYMAQIVDKTSFNTMYMQAGVRYRAHVLNLLDIPFNEV